MNLILLKIL